PALAVVAADRQVLFGAAVIGLESLIGNRPVGGLARPREHLEVLRLEAQAPAAPVHGRAAVHHHAAVVERPFGLADRLVFSLLVVTVVVRPPVEDHVVPPGAPILGRHFGAGVEDEDRREAIGLEDAVGDRRRRNAGPDEDVFEFSMVHTPSASPRTFPGTGAGTTPMRARGLRLKREPPTYPL